MEDASTHRNLEMKAGVKENFEALMFYASLGKKRSLYE